MSRIIPGLLLLIAVTALPQAALAADAANGEKLAKRWCAACHVVASDQKDDNTQVPPFSAVAVMPVSLLKNLSGLGIGLPIRIATVDFLISRLKRRSLLRP